MFEGTMSTFVHVFSLNRIIFVFLLKEQSFHYWVIFNCNAYMYCKVKHCTLNEHHILRKIIFFFSGNALYNVLYSKWPPFTQIICLPLLSPLNHKHFSSSWLLPSSPVKSFVCHESHLSPIKSFGHHDCQRLPKKSCCLPWLTSLTYENFVHHDCHCSPK